MSVSTGYQPRLIGVADEPGTQAQKSPLSEHAKMANLHRRNCLSIWVVGVTLVAASSAISAPRSSQTARHSSVEPISAAQCDDMKSHHVLNSGAPVGCERLKLVKFSYFGFDDDIHDDGEIVVMDAVAGRRTSCAHWTPSRQQPAADVTDVLKV